MYSKKVSLYYDYLSNKEDLPFFRRMMLRLGGPVLDLGCGTGRLALDLATAGLEVVGLDNSHHMLNVAQSKQDKLSPSIRDRIEFVEGDMADLPLARNFTSAIAAGGSFTYLLNSHEQLGCLDNVGKLLPIGGKLVLDLVPPSIELVQGGSTMERSIKRDGDVTLLRRTHTRSNLNTQQCQQTLITEQYKGGVLVEQVLEESVTSLVFPRELMLLLRISGFAIEEVYGSTTGEKFDSNSRRMIVVASKK